MAKFQVTGPDGQKYEVTAPDDATEEQVIAYAQQNMGKQSAMGGSPNAFKEAGKSDPVRSVISTLQGPLMNFADEGLAAVQGGIDRVFKGIPFDTARQQWRDYYRGATEGFAQDNPVLAPVLQAGAGMATGVAGAARGLPTVASVLAPTTAAGRIGTAALAGAGAGALGGAGSAEKLADVPAEAAKGAALGGITGGMLNAVGQGGGAVGRNIIGRAGNSRIVQDRLRDTGIGGTFARSVANTADDLAMQRVATAMQRDGMTADQVAARLRTLGPDTPLAVGAGKNTRDLLDTMATMPGRTSDDAEKLIRQQQAGRADRLIGAAQKGLGTNGARLSQTLASLDEMRSAAAAPMYAQIRDVGVGVDDELGRLLERARPAFAEAEKLARVKGVPFDLPDAIKVAADARRTRPTLSNMLTEPAPPPTVRLGQLDTLKRSLYDMEQANINPETGRLTEYGNALKALRQAIVKKADDATRDETGRSLYEAARNVYAGPSELRAAANLGSQVITKPGWKIDDLTKGLGDAELQAFRIGAMESLREKLGREGGQTEILKMWKEPATQERLRAIFPDLRTYREFAAEVAKEARRKSIETVGRGSQTAARQARMDDESAGFLSGAVDAGTALKMGNPLGVMSAARNLYGRTVMPEPVRDRIGGLLMTQSQDAPALLGDLSRYVQAEQSRRAAAAARSGLLGGVGINSLLGN